MPAFVLDCSVAISWFMPDEANTKNFLDDVVEKGAIVPTIWSLEIGNVLLFAERKKRITPAQRQEALYVLGELPITIDPDTSVHAWLETMTLAERYGLTLYDASYLELARRQSLPLLTFDQQLQQAVATAN